MIILLIAVLGSAALAQEAPDNEFQFNLSGYADNFWVFIFYPNLSLTKRLDDKTAITGRYLVDAITSASMKSRFEVDGVTSATNTRNGGGDNSPDELRHEMGLGITRILAGRTIAVNGLYSTEHDYTSSTVTAQITQPLARNNTVVQLGLVRSWDEVFPQTRDWRRNKDVRTYSAGLTQTLTPDLIVQLNGSYSDMDGHLSDNYQVVTVLRPDRALFVEPVHPGRRIRRAAGMRSNWRLGPRSALQVGYRYYWDTWDIGSHTVSTAYRRYLNTLNLLELTARHYRQDRAFFFQDTYAAVEPLMTVDSKLDRHFSTEVEARFVLNGGPGQWRYLPWLDDERVQLTTSFAVYHRRTDTPDWHSRRRDLIAYLVNFGIRYRW